MGQYQAEPHPRFSAPIDIDQLSRNTAGDRRLEREVLALFRQQTGAYLEALESAPDDGAWCDATHALKGAAHAVGAMRVAKLAEEAERLVGERASKRTIALKDIRRALDETRRFIDYQLLDSAH